MISGILGSINSKTSEIIPGPCWAGTQEASLMRLVELLNMHLEEVRNANPERWDLGRLGALCTNLGVGSQIRLLSELIRYVAYKEKLHPQTVELDELYSAIKPYMKNMFEFIEASSDEEFKSRFTVIFGSSGYHEYFFKLFMLIENDIPELKPEGFEEFKRITSAETTDLADRQVKWIQAVVPTYFKDRLREKFGENYFEIVVPKDVQKACQIKRVDDENEDKMPPEEYLDWIQFATLAGMKEIRDEIKDVLSIPLPDEPSGKHFYRGWFDAINKIRRVAAHPSGRAYKSGDIEVLAVVVDHLKSNLPEHYVDGIADASLS